jgi:outer membrane lipoprotein carrier protein
MTIRSLVAAAAWASLAAASLTARAAHAQSVDATIDRAVAAWAKVRTVRGNFDQTVTNPLTGSSATAHGEFAQERPNRLSIRFNPPDSGAIVADGRYLWIYLPTSAPGQVIKRSATDRGAVPIDITGQFLDAPKSKYDISAAGTRTVDGHPAHGLALVAKSAAASPTVKATVWVDDDDAIIREFESTEQSGVVRHIKLTSLELNGPVSRNLFAFAVPKGAKVVDQTR